MLLLGVPTLEPGDNLSWIIFALSPGFFLIDPGCIYMKQYVTVVTSYGDVACHYGNIALAGMNREANATV